MSKAKKAPSYSLRMAEDLKRWITGAARRNDRSINAEINRLIRQAKEEEEQPKAA